MNAALPKIRIRGLSKAFGAKQVLDGIDLDVPAGTSLVVATHIEVAYSHTGGMPVGMHSFCLSSRRATARIHPDGHVELRTDPQWFTDYYRREGVE